MKKIFLILLVALFTSLAFAETYTVTVVKGEVYYKTGVSKYLNVEVDQELSDSSYLKVSPNSVLRIVDKNGKSYLVNKGIGTLEKLLSRRNTNTVVQNNVAGNATNNGKSSVSTASSRASEAKEDLDWVE